MTRHEEISGLIQSTKAEIARLEGEKAELQQAFDGGRTVHFGSVNQQLDNLRSTLRTYEQELAKEEAKQPASGAS